MDAPPGPVPLTAACADLIKALEECHAKTVFKFLGSCNEAKHDLNMCLRQEVS